MPTLPSSVNYSINAIYAGLAILSNKQIAGKAYSKRRQSRLKGISAELGRVEKWKDRRIQLTIDNSPFAYHTYYS